MKKSGIITIVILGVILLISVFLNAVAISVARDTSQKYQEVSEKYSNCVSDYKELSKKYSDELLEDVDSKITVFDAIAKTIDKNADVFSVSEKVVQIVLPYSIEILDKVESNFTYIVTALEDGYDSCIITFIDDEGICKSGLTITADGKSYPLLTIQGSNE